MHLEEELAAALAPTPAGGLVFDYSVLCFAHSTSNLGRKIS